MVDAVGEAVGEMKVFWMWSMLASVSAPSRASISLII
jgi:hypothetical protein